MRVNDGAANVAINASSAIKTINSMRVNPAGCARQRNEIRSFHRFQHRMLADEVAPLLVPLVAPEL